MAWWKPEASPVIIEGKKEDEEEMCEKVRVYWTPNCPRCLMTRKFLRERGVEFEDVNLALNRGKWEELRRRTGRRTVPIIEIGDELIFGFDEARLREKLGLK